MTRYELRRGDADKPMIQVWARDPGRINLPPAPMLQPTAVGLRSSPDGFEWGYGGSGPFCAAHSILSNHVGFAVDHADATSFKRDFIERMPEEGGMITAMQISAWIKGKRSAGDTSL